MINIFRKTEKKKEFNINQVRDVFYGIKDCLILEENLHLYKLYNITLNRLNMKYFLRNVRKYENNNNLRKIILKLLLIINKEIIKKYKMNFVLDDFYKNISKII